MEAAVIDFAEFAFLNDLSGFLVPGIVNHHVVDGQGKFFLFGELDQLQRIGGFGRHGFFADDMFASLERLHGQGNMGCVVGRHIDGVDVFVGEHFIQRGIPFEAECLGGFLPGGIQVGGADQLSFFKGSEPGFVTGKPFFRNAIFGDAAETNQTITYFHLNLLKSF